MKHSLLITFLLLFIVSCENIRQIAKGDLNENEFYNFYFYNYTSVGDKNKKLFRNCKVFMTHIMNSDKIIKENIFWYSCDTILPIKFFVTTDSTNGLKPNILIADTSNNYLVPINENEREVFAITNKYFSKEGYPTYAIKGFKYLSREDSLTRMPFLKTTIKYYRK
jgi:hypothetical protein